MILIITNRAIKSFVRFKHEFFHFFQVVNYPFFKLRNLEGEESFRYFFTVSYFFVTEFFIDFLGEFVDIGEFFDQLWINVVWFLVMFFDSSSFSRSNPICKNHQLISLGATTLMNIRTHFDPNISRCNQSVQTMRGDQIDVASICLLSSGCTICCWSVFRLYSALNIKEQKKQKFHFYFHFHSNYNWTIH